MKITITHDDNCPKGQECNCGADQKYVTWVDPFGPEDQDMYCLVAVSTAIAWQKNVSRIRTGFVYTSDEAALEDFMSVYWAVCIS